MFNLTIRQGRDMKAYMELIYNWDPGSKNKTMEKINTREKKYNFD